MIKIFLTAFSLMLLASCDAQPIAGVSAFGPSSSREKAVPVIAVSGSKININGTEVWLGDSLMAWKRTLGGTPVCYDAGMIVTCVWHSNGISLGTDHRDKTRVKFMNINIALEPPELGERAPSWPKSPFHGTLELDGFPIYADTEFWTLRRRVAPARDLRCGGRECGNPSAAFSEGANIYMRLAGRSEYSRILHFSISCSSTESCTDLMPKKEKK